MTRRRIVFCNESASRVQLYCSPEFNGDAAEYKLRGRCMDGCQWVWDEIQSCFESGVYTLENFMHAVMKAQSAYQSGFGKGSDEDKVRQTRFGELQELARNSDQVCFIIDGVLSWAPQNWDGTTKALYTAIDMLDSNIVFEQEYGETDWGSNLECCKQGFESILTTLERCGG